MNKLNIDAIARVVALAPSTGAMAEGVMSKADYKAVKEKISAGHAKAIYNK